MKKRLFVAVFLTILGIISYVGCSSKLSSPTVPNASMVEAKGIATSPGVQTNGIATSPGAPAAIAPLTFSPIGYAYNGQWGSYGSGPGQFYWPNGVAVDKNTNMAYVVEKRNDRVQQFTLDGSFVRQWGGQGTATGQFNDPNGIALDGLGHLFVSDSLNQRIQMFDLSGNYLTSWGSYGTGNGQFSYPYGLSANSNGFVYVVDNVNSRVEKFQVTQSLLGTFTATYTTQWPIPKNSNEAGPGPIVQNGSNLYVAVNDHIWEFDNSGTLLYQWGTSGTTPPHFQNIMGLFVDATGELLVADQSEGLIQQWTLDGTYLTSFGVPGSGNGQLQSPTGMSADTAGNLYVCDRDNERIQKFSPIVPTPTFTFTPTVTSTPTSTFTPSPTSTPTSVPTPTLYHFISKWGTVGNGSGQFNWPVGVGVNKTTNRVYVVDQNNNRVQVFDTNGNFLSQWGSQGSGQGQFNAPQAIAVDSQGYIFVADTGNHRFQVFDPNGFFLTQYSNWGSGAGQLNYPLGITVESLNNGYMVDNIYVSDQSNKRVEKFQFNKLPFFNYYYVNYLTQWPIEFQDPDSCRAIAFNGSSIYLSVHQYIEQFDRNGNYLYEWGVSASAIAINGIVVDGKGTLLESQTDHWIEEFLLPGLYSSILAKQGTGDGQFYEPMGMAIDGVGNLYVCDRDNNRIQKFSPN